MRQDETISDYIQRQIGGLEAEAVYRFFKDMGLPEPRGEEFYKTNDGGAIVFLDTYGVAIRFTDNHDFPHHDHPHVLKPLFSKTLGDVRIDINPGIETSVDEKEAARLKTEFFNELGLEIIDGHQYNFGYLPQLAHKYPIILDEIGIMPITKAAQSIKAYLPDPNMDAHNYDPQSEEYAELRALAEKAWPEGTDKPRSQMMGQFWDACSHQKASGALCTSWNSVGGVYAAVPRAASLYAAKLSSYSQ